MALEVNGIGFGYGQRRVLEGVSHLFREGAVTGVVGPNGAGKSTLLRLLLGVARPRVGSVRLDGVEVSGMGARERARRMAYIPQRTSSTFGFSVRECVGMGRLAWGRLEPGNESRAHPPTPPSGRGPVERSLSRVGMVERGEDVFDTLSAGQQQKVVLARALAQLEGAAPPQGAVLLADEPASALDPAHSLESMMVLRRCAAEGVTVIIVLHDFAMAARFCDEAVVLSREGKIAAHGAAGRVLVPEVLDSVFGVRFVRGEGALVATLGEGSRR